jgi:hypothetical protein
MKKANLVSIPTLVESPFIIVTIGGHTFGSYSGTGLSNVEYPNYMKGMSVQKVNGTVNTYNINMSYQVGIGEDPNLLDKIFSKATKDRKITLKYGDWCAPTQIYKEETGIITNITTTLNLRSGSIDYAIECVSDAIGLTAETHDFPGVTDTGSNVLMGLLNNKRYGLQTVFTGMQNTSTVLENNLIASNDKTIKLLPQNNTTVLDYMNYVVDSMTNSSYTDDSQLPDSKYFLTVHDDVNNNFGGTYFKVTEVSSNVNSTNSVNTYEIDVNYPGDNFVTDFNVSNSQSWSILYEYAGKLNQQKYSYKIDNDGNLITTYAPSIVRSQLSGELSATKNEWWARMTKFPIEVTLTIKGLVRPSILMTYVKLNVWFHGGFKHISSGLYVITKQVDQLDSSGYKTTLTLLRVGGDE